MFELPVEVPPDDSFVSGPFCNLFNAFFQSTTQLHAIINWMRSLLLTNTKKTQNKDLFCVFFVLISFLGWVCRFPPLAPFRRKEMGAEHGIQKYGSACKMDAAK